MPIKRSKTHWKFSPVIHHGKGRFNESKQINVPSIFLIVLYTLNKKLGVSLQIFQRYTTFQSSPFQNLGTVRRSVKVELVNSSC